MKLLKAFSALALFTSLISLSGCKSSDAVRKEGGALERELNYENAVQSEEASLGAAIY